MSKRFLIILVLCLIGLAGCAVRPVAGPFVTDVSYDGEGNLIITKNMIVYDWWSSEISNGDNPQTVVIKKSNK